MLDLTTYPPDFCQHGSLTNTIFVRYYAFILYYQWCENNIEKQ